MNEALFCIDCTAGFTLIAKYAKTIAKCEKQKVYSGVFCVTFFVFHVPFLAFCISQHFACQGRHLRKKSKDFVVYFFATLIKHKICMKYEKCIAGLTGAIYTLDVIILNTNLITISCDAVSQFHLFHVDSLLEKYLDFIYLFLVNVK